MELDLIDVFGSAPMRGNPLAVVRDADGLEGEEMLALTRWLGFSETTFLLPPTDPAADYRVRIFYPAGELDFAGHPTLGTCHAWLAAGGTARREGLVVQECGVGLVEIKRGEGTLAFCAPPLRRSGPLSVAERAEAARVAGVDEADIFEALHADNGPGWQLLRLKSAAAVLAAQPVARAAPETDIGLIGPADGTDGIDWEVRAFFADQNGRMVEDPVTGSFNAGAATYLLNAKDAPDRLRAAQGRTIGADGRIEWSIDSNRAIWIAGQCHTIASGASLPQHTG